NYRRAAFVAERFSADRPRSETRAAARVGHQAWRNDNATFVLVLSPSALVLRVPRLWRPSLVAKDETEGRRRTKVEGLRTTHSEPEPCIPLKTHTRGRSAAAVTCQILVCARDTLVFFTAGNAHLATRGLM